MRKICAWCKNELGSSTDEAKIDDEPISHGMCGDCARKALSHSAKPLRDFLDQFSLPVFLVTSEGKIVTANSAGLALLRKKPEDVDGRLGGEAFGCRYADLPGGCGQTIHCRTCTIRNAVAHTLESGKSNVKIPAYPDLHRVTGDKRIRFLISTEKLGEAVLLRIDDVAEEDAT